MTRRTSSFLIGLFVIIGIFLGIFALGWFGEAQRYFRSYKTYVAFFTESVRGLDRSSSVAYRGIDIGHIQSIEIAPDPRYVMITMRIRRPELITGSSVAEIATSGIAGASYVNISPLPPGQSASATPRDVPVRYPVIPTRPAELPAMLSSAQAVVAQLQQADIKGLVQEASRTVRLAGDVLGGRQTRDILAGLQKTAGSLGDSAAALDAALAQGQLSKLLAELQRSVADTQSLLERLNSQLAAAELPEAAAATRRTVRDLDEQTRILSSDVGVTLENLQQASDTLQKLLERLYARPSELLFSQPLPARSGTR